MSDATLPQSLILVGAGKMGGAMLEGWLKVGLRPQGLTVLDPRPSEAMTALCSDRGIALNPRQGRRSPRCDGARHQAANAR
jgi:pyrroline-5-carboxylate reductase